uniref:Uncharacterized protein n=1 Tax=Microviridae sp. ctX401 TaxID=2827644 RepID=A0A8S5TM16_9VIRU|nr:MAG TPA: hypothetical protein [Microviridae sp. ctX401]
MFVYLKNTSFLCPCRTQFIVLLILKYFPKKKFKIVCLFEKYFFPLPL